jgi:hypothetical protein
MRNMSVEGNSFNVCRPAGDHNHTMVIVLIGGFLFAGGCAKLEAGGAATGGRQGSSGRRRGS